MWWNWRVKLEVALISKHWQYIIIKSINKHHIKRPIASKNSFIQFDIYLLHINCSLVFFYIDKHWIKLKNCCNAKDMLIVSIIVLMQYTALCHYYPLLSSWHIDHLLTWIHSWMQILIRSSCLQWFQFSNNSS